MTSQRRPSYVAHHLKIAGRPDHLFTEDDLTLIHITSRGYPRAVNNLSLHALVAAFATGKNLVDDAAARAAVRRSPATETSNPGGWAVPEANLIIDRGRSRMAADEIGCGGNGESGEDASMDGAKDDVNQAIAAELQTHGSASPRLSGTCRAASRSGVRGGRRVRAAMDIRGNARRTA